MQKLQMTVGSSLAVGSQAKPHKILRPSAHDRTHISRRASAIAERIYDAVYER